MWDHKIFYRRIKKTLSAIKKQLLKASKACCKRNGGCKRSAFLPFASSAFMRELLKMAAFLSFQTLQILYIAAVLHFQRLEILYIAAFLSFQRLNSRISALSKAGTTANSSSGGCKSMGEGGNLARLKNKAGGVGGVQPPPICKHNACIRGVEKMRML